MSSSGEKPSVGCKVTVPLRTPSLVAHAHVSCDVSKQGTQDDLCQWLPHRRESGIVSRFREPVCEELNKNTDEIPTRCWRWIKLSAVDQESRASGNIFQGFTIWLSGLSLI